VTGDPDAMPCRDVVELITDYLDDALPAPQKADLEAHLADCDGCATVLDQFRATVTVTGRLAQDDLDALDPTTRDALLGVFRGWSAAAGD
jgi:anti-sigma factor RsiW